MTSSKTYFHWLATAAAIAGLAGCGGYTTVDLGGTVTGLVTDGLVLQNGSDTVAIPKNATSYTFPNQIGTHDEYSVTVKSQPAYYTCGVSNTPGRASGLAITYVDVSCVKTTRLLGGNISGLTSGGLVLANGSDQVSVAANATSFVFPTAVAEQDTYGIVVLTQPSNPAQTCTVQNGAGTMGSASPADITVTCQ